MTLYKYICHNPDCSTFRKEWGVTSEVGFCSTCGQKYTNPPTTAEASPTPAVDNIVAMVKTPENVSKMKSTALDLMKDFLNDEDFMAQIHNAQIVTQGFFTEPGPSKQALMDEIRLVRKELRTLAAQNETLYKLVKKNGETV